LHGEYHLLSKNEEPTPNPKRININLFQKMTFQEFLSRCRI
jgi:hypothetical protein